MQSDMGRLIIFLMLSAILITMPLVQGLGKDPKAVEDWFKKLTTKKEKLTKLHFYFHDTLSGKNPTGYSVAQSNITSTSATFFGKVFMIDDPLTIGPEPNSPVIGQAQGLYGSAGLEEVSLMMNLNFVFTNGEYKGSTLMARGRNPAPEKYREMPIQGESGVFRLARGIATAKTYWLNFTSGDAIVEYNVMVIHY
ncbi:hypothetical protein LguiA_027630 [Lonicera macranthoides]